MNKYQTLLAALTDKGSGRMKCFGNSMVPILPNPSTCTYKREKSYRVGDIVFCKVNGRYIDAHKITKIAADGRYLISNNKGHDNGWTAQVFGRVIRAMNDAGRVCYEV